MVNHPAQPSPDDTVRDDAGGWISGPCDALEAALAAARELLASTVETVNPSTSRRDLFACVTQYRKHLADLVAACSGADSAWSELAARKSEVRKIPASARALRVLVGG